MKKGTIVQIIVAPVVTGADENGNEVFGTESFIEELDIQDVLEPIPAEAKISGGYAFYHGKAYPICSVEDAADLGEKISEVFFDTYNKVSGYFKKLNYIRLMAEA